ncbi:MAG TPA: anti-sigma factor antagonist [Candidatus Pelethenecus faecipullorum]|uniref:Anti-sigma factor antagonist n=1 Tax=Candidatus Pelethenecus faecipullorum TaxID=2840900 RepID=A0A9D1GS21_9MOLU|nr:anti-sigma factor antagonist [Candidatus Pelethenecus faecipullorum]
MGLNVGVYVKKDVLILRLKGELDDLSVSDLRMRISKYISDYSIVHLVINVKDLNFLDSSGIGFIIGRYHQLKKTGGDITISNLHAKIERIIYVSGLAKICKIRDTEESVLISLGGKAYV